MRKQLGAILGIVLMLTACKRAETPGADTLVATSKAARISARAAQQVTVTTSGLVGITTGVPVLYLSQWAMQQTEYGFFWLDAVNLTGGHIQAISKCVGGFPPSNSALYVLGDCNSITSVGGSIARGYAEVLVTSGQCGAQTRGCGGPRTDGHWIFDFTFGSWEYSDNDTPLQRNDPANQQADPNGLTWQIRPTDGTNRNFAWTVIGTGPTPPPVTVTLTPPTQPSNPTATPRPTSPPPSPTACVDVPHGRVGQFGRCFDCAGNVTDGDPCGRPFGAPCCAPATVTPAASATPGETATPVASSSPTPVTPLPTATRTPSVPPTALPSGSPTPCVIRSGGLTITGPCG